MKHRFRFILLVIVTVSAYFFLSFRLYHLQIERGEEYLVKAQSQLAAAGALEPHRGIVYFTDKNSSTIPAATNRASPAIFAVPAEIGDPAAVAAALAPLLELDQQKLAVQLSNGRSQYELLVKRATEEQILRVHTANLTGVYLENQEARVYPFETLAAHLLGFISPTDAGRTAGAYGLELFYEERLAGSPGSIQDKKIFPAVDGQDITLTIDRDIQTRAEEILADLARRYQAAGGSVIVQEPKTGRILAMTSIPSFDPNRYGEADIAAFLNPAVQSVYEPGSIFKVLTMAAGIDSGAITPETTYQDSGAVTVGDRVITNWDLKRFPAGHGRVTMAQVIEQSINTGAVFAERQIGHQIFYQYLHKFGFGKPTQVNLPGELAGDLSNLTVKNNQVYPATASFGQGIAVTPVQLVTAIASLANGGRLMRPTLIMADEPEEAAQVISSDAARQVTAMMENALTKAEVGRVDGYRLAGKTGTAQVPDFKRGGYTHEVINSYVGFGPVSQPRFVILFKLDKPAGAPLAGQTVVPAFRELAQFILNYYAIPPDSP